MPFVTCDGRRELASPDREVEHDHHEHIDRNARKAPRLEPPLRNCRQCFFIEPAAVQGPADPDLRRASVGCDDEFQDDSALNL